MTNNFDLRKFLSENKINTTSQNIREGSSITGHWVMYAEPNKGTKQFIKMFPSEEEAKQALEQAPTKYGAHVLKGNWNIMSAEDWKSLGKELDSKYTGHPDHKPTPKTTPDQDKEALKQFNKVRQDFYENVEEEKSEEELNESREDYLTRLVENALGITPAPVAEESNDEMVDENPLPKYKNIDELMKNIESGTNEAAHKYKMNRMKEIADALESKVTSLEEGENAEHIDQKAVKAMKKDVMTLRKGVEKLEKEYEKKFAKKEKKEYKDKLNEGFNLKSVLRKIGWAGEDWTPQEFASQIKKLDDATLIAWSKDFKGVPNTPLAFQQKLIKIELKKRGLENE